MFRSAYQLKVMGLLLALAVCSCSKEGPVAATNASQNAALANMDVNVSGAIQTANDRQPTRQSARTVAAAPPRP